MNQTVHTHRSTKTLYILKVTITCDLNEAKIYNLASYNEMFLQGDTDQIQYQTNKINQTLLFVLFLFCV